jgi:hypothetical protein
MDVENLRRKLISVARDDRPREDVPYAFEKRIMARLGSPQPTGLQVSAPILWRAVAACLVIMILTSGWIEVSQRMETGSESLALALEDAVLAPLDFDGESL